MADDDQPSTTERILIDPERLIKLKHQRKSLKMVPSVFEPPPSMDTDYTELHHFRSPSLPSLVSARRSITPLPKSQNPQVQFFLQLLPLRGSNSVSNFEEGDCMQLQGDDRWLLVQGQMKITGANQYSYCVAEGYMFFVSLETRKKIKEIVCLTECKLIKLTPSVFKDYVKNYLFLKNAEKIKYLKYCPFFLWSTSLSEDLSLAMHIQSIPKASQPIYKANDESDCIYFVKEGIVLLERSNQLNNRVIIDYEKHYDKSETQGETVLVVKKGMVFGIDGILLKEQYKIQKQKIQQFGRDNPQGQFHSYELKQKRSTRVYTARAIGKAELYALPKSILETLFSLSDLSTLQLPMELSSKELERICIEYTDLIMKHKNNKMDSRLMKSVSRREMVLMGVDEQRERMEMRGKVRQIRQEGEKVRKKSIASIIPKKGVRRADRTEKQTRIEETTQFANNQLASKLNSPISSIKFAFPIIQKPSLSLFKNKQTENKYSARAKLDKSKEMHRLIYEQIEREMGSRQSKHSKDQVERRKTKIMQKISLINIKAYRSIINSLK